MKNRLEIQIAGGLGNQLFMLFAGLFFADYLGKNAAFDVSDLRRIKKLHPGRNLVDLGLLDGYPVSDKSSFFADSPRFRKFLNGGLVGGNADRWIHRKTFRPKEFGYVAPELIPEDTKRLRGYFQTWRYVTQLNGFSRVKAVIESAVSPWALNMGEELESTSPLCLHIRRSDYVLSKNRPIGLLSLEYFAEIAFRYPSESIWIFTDSPNEFKEIDLVLKSKIQIVNPPKGSDHIDSLYLMSKAKSLAISNSTYSWWAAMITRPETQIFAPRKWFRSLSDPIDLIPISWTAIESQWADL